MNSQSKLLLAAVACMTLGMAPFSPEPHIIGKLRWLAGGGDGMTAMDYGDLLMHGLPWLFLLYVLYQTFFSNSARNLKMDIQSALLTPNVTIIDVREPSEFGSEHLDGAINMPLSQFNSYTAKIKQMPGEKVLYCRSGNRSGQAVKILNELGVANAHNGGSLALMKLYSRG